MRRFAFTLKQAPRLLLVALLVVMMAAACKKEPEVSEDEVIVRVGSAKLLLNDIASEIPPALQARLSKEDVQEFVLRWINNEVLYQEAIRQGLPQRIDMAAELKRLERDLVVSALVDHELGSHNYTVSDDQIQQHYEDNKESFRRNEDEVHVLHIFVHDKAVADSLYDHLKGRGDFANVAAQYAVVDGQAMPTEFNFAESEIPPAMRAVFNGRPGATLNPIELEDGYHLFKIVEKFKSGTYRDLALVREELTSKLQAQMRDRRYVEYLSELRSNARIETNFHTLEAMPIDSILARVSRISNHRR